jgi:hypothetical protein
MRAGTGDGHGVSCFWGETDPAGDISLFSLTDGFLSFAVTRRYLGVTQDDQNEVYLALDFSA